MSEIFVYGPPEALRALTLVALNDEDRSMGETIDEIRQESPEVVVDFDSGPRAEQAAPDWCEHVREALQAAQESGAKHYVLVSSVGVNIASHHHPSMVHESYLPTLHRESAARRWRELEEIAEESRAGMTLTILRPAAMPAGIWPDPLSRALDKRAAFAPLGFNPTVQVLDPQSFAEAVRRIALRALEGSWDGGVYNVAPNRCIPLKHALRGSRTLRLPTPFPILWLLRRLFSIFGLARGVEELDVLRYPRTFAGEKLFEALDSWTPATSAAALNADAGRETIPDEDYDDFGQDKAYVALLSKTLFRFLRGFWWRIEWDGFENVPKEGPIILVGLHRGHQPWDGVMAYDAFIRRTGRYPRFLIHPTLTKFSFLAPYMIGCGGVIACKENADRILERGDDLAIFPEGIRGAFSLYKDSYELKRFGRDHYLRFALNHGVPLVPFVTVGSAEIFPVLVSYNWGWWKRLSEWPCFPVTPTMGTVPLPSKWHTVILEPERLEEYGPETAKEVKTVRKLSKGVQARMKHALDTLRTHRPSIWFGSIFKKEAFFEELRRGPAEAS